MTNTVFMDMIKDIKVPESKNSKITVDAIDNMRAAIESENGFILATETDGEHQSLICHGMGADDMAQVVINIFNTRPEVGLLVALFMAHQGKNKGK